MWLSASSPAVPNSSSCAADALAIGPPAFHRLHEDALLRGVARTRLELPNELVVGVSDRLAIRLQIPGSAELRENETFSV